MPPYYPNLRYILEPGRNSHLARLSPLLVYTEALPRRQRSSQFGESHSAAIFEVPVAATIVLGDSRRQDDTAYLALLRCVNDADSLEQLLNYVSEMLLRRGYRKVIGPTGLSPHIGSGLLQDYWDRLPPMYTPYNPPYLPEILGNVLHTRSRSQLYHLEIGLEPPPTPRTPAELFPLEPTRLATDLLSLLVAACPPWLDFAPPDVGEAAFLLRWLGKWPLLGWLAYSETKPVGFVLLQPDLAPQLRRAKGGRNPLWRLWLNWATRRPVRRGRVLFGAVLPQWREQGIGHQLLHQAMVTGYQQGWQSLSIGPLPSTSPAGKFLERYGAQPQQSYLLYQREL